MRAEPLAVCKACMRSREEEVQVEEFIQNRIRARRDSLGDGTNTLSQ